MCSFRSMKKAQKKKKDNMGVVAVFSADAEQEQRAEALRQHTVTVQYPCGSERS